LRFGNPSPTATGAVLKPKQARIFFSEEKKQKTFICLGCAELAELPRKGRSVRRRVT
jgi:hypothetical protein